MDDHRDQCEAFAKLGESQMETDPDPYSHVASCVAQCILSHK